MKKSLAGLIGAALLIIPIATNAQVATTTRNANPNAGLIAILTQLVQTLETEIQQILANQATQSQQISSIAGSVGQVQNTTMTEQTQSTSEASMAPACVPNPVLNIDVSTSSEKQHIVDFTYSDECNTADQIQTMPIPVSYLFTDANGNKIDDGTVSFPLNARANSRSGTPLGWSLLGDLDQNTIEGQFVLAAGSPSIPNGSILSMTIGSTTNQITYPQ